MAKGISDKSLHFSHVALKDLEEILNEHPDLPQISKMSQKDIRSLKDQMRGFFEDVKKIIYTGATRAIVARPALPMRIPTNRASATSPKARPTVEISAGQKSLRNIRSVNALLFISIAAELLIRSGCLSRRGSVPSVCAAACAYAGRYNPCLLQNQLFSPRWAKRGTATIL